MKPADEPNEQLMPLRGTGLGEASEQVVAVGERLGYSVAATGPGSFSLARSRRPTWAVVLAVLGFPVLGLGLLFLLIRRNESVIASVFEDREGTKLRLVGRVDDAFVAFFAGLSASAPSPELSPEPMPQPAAPPLSAPSPGAPPPSFGPPSAQVPQAPPTAPPVRPSVPQSSEPMLHLPDGRLVAVGRGLILGRSPQATTGASELEPVVLKDLSLSKTHCSVTPAGGGVVIIDLHSTNGTSFTDDHGAGVCCPGEPTTVRVGASILAGDVTIVVGERS